MTGAGSTCDQQIKILGFSIKIFSFSMKILSFSTKILSFSIEILPFSIEILSFSITTPPPTGGAAGHFQLKSLAQRPVTQKSKVAIS